MHCLADLCSLGTETVSTQFAFGSSLTDQSTLCYNSFKGQGQLLLVGVWLQHSFGPVSLVSMVSVNLRIWFYGVEEGDAGQTMEREESQ
jgi:hypothetical protein